MKLRTELLRIQEVMNVKKTLITEAVVDGKIICDNCGWEWKMSDGGNDLYICHKCNHDNTPNWITELKPIQPYKKKILFKFFDKNGIKYSKSINDFAKLSGNQFQILMYEYLGGVYEFNKFLEKKYLGKEFRCVQCGYGNLNFTYKIWGIGSSWDTDSYYHFIEVDADVLYGTYKDSERKIHQLRNIENNHQDWDEIEDEVRVSIKEQLDEKIFYDLYDMETQVSVTF
jgi:hypothetical protein